MTRLSVNLNKIALLRNSRGHNFPNLVSMAQRALDNGARGITLHPRPDQRHATYADVLDMKEVVSRYPGAELNIEGNPIPKFMEVVLDARPDQVTLVPDSPDQLTSDHGYDVHTELSTLQSLIARFKASDIRVSIFLDPAMDQVEAAPQTGTDRIELYTEAYAAAFNSNRFESVYDSYRKAALRAAELGLGVNAGHDLDLENLASLLQIPVFDEVSIGHALTVEAFDYGWDTTIRKYVSICENG